MQLFVQNLFRKIQFNIIGMAVAVAVVLVGLAGEVKAANITVVKPTVQIGQEAFYYKANYMLPPYYSPEGKNLFFSLDVSDAGKLGLVGREFWLQQSDLSGVLYKFVRGTALVFCKEVRGKKIPMYLYDFETKHYFGIKLREVNKDGEEVSLYEQITGEKTSE
jgi:hypothetical protein